MNADSDMLAQFARLDAMRARLGPFSSMVREWVQTWGDLEKLNASRHGSKAARKEKSAQLEAKMRADWPIVARVQQSEQLIARLYEQTLKPEAGEYDHAADMLVDALWTHIRALREVVPLAQKSARNTERRKEKGSAAGKKFGFKGGRPSKKPLRVELESMFKRHLECGSNTKARANLVKELTKKKRVSLSTARTWLRDAEIK